MASARAEKCTMTNDSETERKRVGKKHAHRLQNVYR